MISEERFNLVMEHKQRAANRAFAALQLLSECSIYVPEDVRESIISMFEGFCNEESNVYWKRTGDHVTIRRIQ